MKFYLLLMIVLLSNRMVFGQSLYHYDLNGNLIADSNKTISSIKYNILNLPETIIYQDGRKIEYTYTASGTKLSQKVYLADGSLRQNKDYLFDLVYADNSLEFLSHPQGYNEPNNQEGFSYIYQHKDHLGNIRVSFKDQQIKETKDYYPFGLQLAQSKSILRGRKHNYGYNNKELNEVFDLNWCDYGARRYDPSSARWMSIDPLAEKYSSISTYAYVANNPIRFIDPDGKQIFEDDKSIWSEKKRMISNRRNNLQNSLKELISEGANQDKIDDMEARVSGLNYALTAMNRLEQSDRVFQLKKVDNDEDIETTYDKDSKRLVIAYNNTATFVHEVIHGDQFENGDVIYNENTGLGLGTDLADEVMAFKAQYSYDPETLGVSSQRQITSNWILNTFQKYDDHAKIPLNINSTKSDFIRAYPNKFNLVNKLPNNFIFRNSRNIIYKDPWEVIERLEKLFNIPN